MKDQVTSIEQSKRLIELGVPVEKASMVWRWGWVCGTVDEENYELKIWQECKMDKILAYQEFPESFIPAFTVADLLGIIPKTITDGRGIVYKLNIGICSSTNHCWYLYWGDDERQIGWQERISILNALEDAIEWIVITGRKLNL